MTETTQLLHLVNSKYHNTDAAITTVLSELYDFSPLLLAGFDKNLVKYCDAAHHSTRSTSVE